MSCVPAGTQPVQIGTDTSGCFPPSGTGIERLPRVVMNPVFFPVQDDIDLPVDPAAVSDSLRRLLLRYYYLSIILSMTYLIRPDKENFGTTDER